jgi:hypothetical protein
MNKVGFKSFSYLLSLWNCHYSFTSAINLEKVLLASHQLSDPAADWWVAYVEAHEEPESINWPEFRAAFRAHHVPQGVIKLKKKEFQDMKQGSMSVNEYVTKFT